MKKRLILSLGLLVAICLAGAAVWLFRENDGFLMHRAKVFAAEVRVISTEPLGPRGQPCGARVVGAPLKVYGPEPVSREFSFGRDLSLVPDQTVRGVFVWLERPEDFLRFVHTDAAVSSMALSATDRDQIKCGGIVPGYMLIRCDVELLRCKEWVEQALQGLPRKG
jgi:hypothetical protein